jgi:hypothetical protein
MPLIIFMFSAAAFHGIIVACRQAGVAITSSALQMASFKITLLRFI